MLAALERGPMTGRELANVLDTHEVDACNRAFALIGKGRVVWHPDGLKYGLADGGNV